MSKLLTSLLIIFCLTQCKNDDGGITIKNPFEEEPSDLPPPTDTIYVSNELKSYYFFPKGSWWVYKRIDTNAVVYDTAVVATVYNELEYSRFLPYAWEAAAVGITHSYYKAPEGFVEPKLSVGTGNLGGFVDRISMSSQGLLFRSNYDFFSVPIDSISIASKSYPTVYSILVDTNAIIVNNIRYNDVVQLRYGIPEYEDKIWLSKNVGLIKYFNVGDSTNWELINYEIKP